jgi:hypothetical protein
MSSPSHLGVPRQDDASWVVNNVPDIHVGEGHLCRLCIHSGVLSNGFNWMTRFYYNRKLGYLDKIRSKMERKQLHKDYGTVEELFSRKACPICALILQAIPTEIILLCASPPTTIVDSRTQEHVHILGWDRRLDFTVLFKAYTHNVQITTLHFNCPQLVLRPWRLFSNHRLGHLPTNSTLFDQQTFNTDLAVQWINDCQEKHSCAVIGDAVRDPQLSDFLLIDVVADCLVSANPTHTKFITLSYVWGNVPTLKTTLETLPALKNEGSLSHSRDQLPRIIKDSILLTKHLALRYLWVDALCIIDDSAQKHHQIAHMDFIYSRAYLTIIPLSATAASSPIPGVQKGTRYQPRNCSSRSGMKVEFRPPSLQNTLDSSAYETRGWTFQERVMSKRCLFFTAHEVFFVCHVGTENATLCAEPGLRQTLDGEAHILSRFNSVWMSGSKDLDVILRGVWTAIEHYTTRELSYAFDALNAFSGIMSVASNMFGLTFLYGLPEQALDSGLLWYSWNGPKRNRYFPSWTWAGWNGGVIFKFSKMDVRTEIEISREDKWKIPTELGARSDGSITAQPEILCFSTTKVKASEFSVDLEERTIVHQIRTTDGLACRRFFGEDTTDSVLNTMADDVSFVLLSRSRSSLVLDYYWDQSCERRPWVSLNVLLVEQKGNTMNEFEYAKYTREPGLQRIPSQLLSN